MVIDQIGKITDSVYMIGSSGVPVYLIDGDFPALLDAGFAFVGKRYVNGIVDVLVDRKPAYQFLSHAHYDHCGAVSFFKKNFPGLQVIASEKAKKILQRPKAIELIYKLNQSAEDASKKGGMLAADLTGSFEAFNVDMVVKENDVIRISDALSIKIIETPGHTRDSISLYIPEQKILFSSEALGVPDKTGYINSDFLIDYDIYLNSMKKLDSLDVEILCLGHHYAYTGKDASEYIQKSLVQCDEFRQLVETCVLEEKGDLKRIMSRIKKFEYDGKPGPQQQEAAYLLNLEARIKVIQKRMEEKKSG